jgi:hypothetical protein
LQVITQRKTEFYLRLPTIYTKHIIYHHIMLVPAKQVHTVGPPTWPLLATLGGLTLSVEQNMSVQRMCREKVPPQVRKGKVSKLK